MNPRLDDEDEYETENSVTILENESLNRIELHIRGAIPSPHDLQGVLIGLYCFSETYDTIAVYCNTPGGDLYTLVELLAALGKYKHRITIAGGLVASAGFLIWCSGTHRVVQPYCSLMCHRESLNLGA